MKKQIKKQAGEILKSHKYIEVDIVDEWVLYIGPELTIEEAELVMIELYKFNDKLVVHPVMVENDDKADEYGFIVSYEYV